MTHPLPNLLRTLQASLIVLALPAVAQVPNTLLHSIPAPPVGLQSGAQLGYSVALDGSYAVIGAPLDDMRASDTGVVKIFDSANGALLFVLQNPTPSSSDAFGYSLAISGTWLVVGAPGDNSGASAAGIVYAYDLSSETPTIPWATLRNPSPSAGDNFGISVSIYGLRVVVGAYSDDTGASNAGSAYVYDLGSVAPNVPIATLNNPGPSADDRFGNAVAISGTRVVVGTALNNFIASDAGSAYLYDLNSGTPSIPVLTLNNPSPANQEYFGYSVAISGTKVVVGANQDNTGAIAAGRAFVYDVAGTTPTVPVITLDNPSQSVGDRFGTSVALTGPRLVVGAFLDDTGATQTGAAYVYDLGSVSPTVPEAILNNPSPAMNDAFGWSVAISGTQVLVGAYQDDTGATDAGSAYLYDVLSPTPTVPEATLNNPGLGSMDRFGYAVAMSNALLVIGATQDDTGATDAGSAYVYNLGSGTPTLPVATLNNPVPAAYDHFGFSVAIAGTRVVVSAPADDTGAEGAGSAYVYDLSSGTPTVPVAALYNPSPEAGDFFGSSVAISDTRVVIGASSDNAGAEDSGNAYVYDLTSGAPTVPLVTLNNPSPGADDQFGRSVGISGTRVVIGAYADSTGATYAGSAYVYDLTSGTPTVPMATLNNPGPAGSDFFGYAVAISGTRVAVGAYCDDMGATDAGSVYTYDLSSGTPTVPVTTINNPAPATSDYFGNSVAISGTRLVVGAYGDSVIDIGSAYVYDLESNTPTVPVAMLSNPGPNASDQFGFSVAIDDTTVVIGTPFDDSVTADKGFAYVFGPHPLDQDSDGLRDAWELTHWPTTTGHSSLDDSDHDGIVELLELAFGLNPTLPSAGGLPPAIDEGGYLTMTITKQAGVTYEVQSAGSLLPALPDSFSAASTTVLTNNATTLKVRDNFLIGSSPPRFMRVKVTAAP